MNKKILYVITRSEWGGAQKHLIDVVIGMKKKGLSPIVAVGDEGDLTRELEKNNVEFYIINNLVHQISLKQDLKAILELRNLVKKINPSIIHLHSSKAGLVGRIATKVSNYRIPVIFTAHGWGFTPGSKKINKYISLLSELLTSWMLNKVICVSKFDQELAEKYHIISKKKLTYVYNGISKDMNVDLVDIDKKREKVLFTMVARFDSQKDYLTLVKAIEKLKNNKEIYNQIQFNFVGKGPLYEEIQKEIINRKIDDVVNLLGFRNDILEIINQSDVFVLTSNYEGLPISIIEAMSLEKPLIVSDVGGVRELIDKNGFLIAKGKNEIKNIGKAIVQLTSDDRLRIEMGENSLSIFQNKFTLEQCVNNTEKIYKIYMK
ncbi:glycosyltransferase family 4 protein [Priestia megaterium]|uniref:glycosyltransferase family 4 protein n=1 Tax=Priestia megaterium TaxID=1404 RepID=UPI001BE677D2|nr:glycosyltransferase family 4 protein [Priestia megaterium]MBT2259242.1 glycosyltransferase family 4 protein [Priestia megaterium]